jgi:hypothetical protein
LEAFVYLHRLEKNFIIKCGFELCSSQFKNINTLRNHITRSHNIDDQNAESFFDLNCNVRIDDTNTSCKKMKCSSCDFRSSDMTAYRNHFLKHFNDYTLLNCFYENCNYSSKSSQNYRSHHSKFHRNDTIKDFKL